MAADIQVRRGDSFALVITIPPGQGVESLAGLTPSCEIRGAADRLTATAFVLNGASRRVSVSASAGQTMRLPLGMYRFVLELRNVGGLVRSSYVQSLQVTDGIFDG